MLISPLKKMKHPTVSTYSLCWTAMIRNNSFSKMCTYAKHFIRCYNAYYVNKGWLYGPDKGTFYTYKYICIYIHICTYVHTQWKPLHPLCSWSHAWKLLKPWHISFLTTDLLIRIQFGNKHKTVTHPKFSQLYSCRIKFWVIMSCRLLYIYHSPFLGLPWRTLHSSPKRRLPIYASLNKVISQENWKFVMKLVS